MFVLCVVSKDKRQNAGQSGQTRRGWNKENKRYKKKFPVGARFSALVQTGPGAHQASHTMGVLGSFLGVKRPRRGFNHPPPSSAEVKERAELYFYFSCGPSWQVIVTFAFTYYITTLINCWGHYGSQPVSRSCSNGFLSVHDRGDIDEHQRMYDYRMKVSEM
jgi:hypothetical protein